MFRIAAKLRSTSSCVQADEDALICMPSAPSTLWPPHQPVPSHQNVPSACTPWMTRNIISSSPKGTRI